MVVFWMALMFGTSSAFVILHTGYDRRNIQRSCKNKMSEEQEGEKKGEESSTSWQNQVDELLRVKGPSLKSRKDNLFGLIKNTRTIVSDVTSAVRERDAKIVFPPELGYSKTVSGLSACRRQILSDIIPGSITKGIPRVVEETPNIVRGTSKLIRTLPQKGKNVVGWLGDLSRDPSMLQYNLDRVKKEVRNIIHSTPQGIYSPSYETIKTNENYQIRSYIPYSVASVPLDGGDGIAMDPFDLTSSFTQLAQYVFGEGQFYMTTPVICGAGMMEIPLPAFLDSSSAPESSNDAISFYDIPADIVAVREFPGFATDGEISRQRAMLEDALLADGIVYDNLSFRVFQYNPPQTLPWLRRNEVVINVNYAVHDATKVESL